MLGSVDPGLEHDADLAQPLPAREPAASEPDRDRGRALERTAGGIGNRSFTRLVARMGDGEGILPSGVVHPDVEAAIAASRGRGRQLDAGLAGDVGGALGDSLHDVRVHTDEHAAALARAVSARAFTVGPDIFFGQGEYNPATADGARLIAHEATHVVQQRGGPVDGPLIVSHPGDAMEREAEAVAHDLGG